jgi:(1->4)-alpha-D-glucan 1-alpha-D-glucosylmutase
VLDVVPNHMAVSEPESQNAPWWSLLRDGRESPYADWFDVEWDSPDNPGKVLVPVLGAPLGEVVDELELLEDRIRYYDHEVPISPAPGSTATSSRRSSASPTGCATGTSPARSSTTAASST